MWLEVSDAREGAGFVGESLPPDAGRREDGGRSRGGHGAPPTGSSLGEERGLTRRAPAQRPGVPPGAEVARPRHPCLARTPVTAWQERGPHSDATAGAEAQ